MCRHVTLEKTKINPAVLASRGAVFSLIWWILTDGDPQSWWIGAPAVVLAVTASVALLPPIHIVWYEFFRFMPFFFMRSLLGGADVAWRALHPRMPIAPDIINYSMRLPQGPPQVFMANIASLLPGTLVAEINQQTLKVHVLDGRNDALQELEVLEQHLIRIFGISLLVPEGGD